MNVQGRLTAASLASQAPGGKIVAARAIRLIPSACRVGAEPASLQAVPQEEDRQPLQYLNAFVRMYGADAVEAASAAMSGEAAFYGLQPVDSDLHAFAAHQSLLKAYEKLQRAKAAFWAK